MQDSDIVLHLRSKVAQPVELIKGTETYSVVMAVYKET